MIFLCNFFFNIGGVFSYYHIFFILEFFDNFIQVFSIDFQNSFSKTMSRVSLSLLGRGLLEQVVNIFMNIEAFKASWFETR